MCLCVCVAVHVRASVTQWTVQRTLFHTPPHPPPAHTPPHPPGGRLPLFQALSPVFRFDIPAALFVAPYLVHSVLASGSGEKEGGRSDVGGLGQRQRAEAASTCHTPTH